MQKINDRQKNKELKDFRYGNKWGLSIGVAHYWFGYFYSGYFMFLSFVLLGIPDGIFGGVNLIVATAIIALPIALGLIIKHKKYENFLLGAAYFSTYIMRPIYL